MAALPYPGRRGEGKEAEGSVGGKGNKRRDCGEGKW